MEGTPRLFFLSMPCAPRHTREALPETVQIVRVIICESCPILLPMNDPPGALVAGPAPGHVRRCSRGAYSCMEHETTRVVVEGERVVALTSAAAVVLAEIVRGYQRAHGLGGTRETDLGDFGDEHGPAGVRGVHPDQHRRSEAAEDSRPWQFDIAQRLVATVGGQIVAYHDIDITRESPWPVGRRRPGCCGMRRIRIGGGRRW